jgi:hypothetical protein
VKRKPKPYGFRPWWRRLWCGRWTQNRLLSRKWCLVSITVAVTIVASLAGRELGSATLTYLGIVVPAYLLVEGALDWAWKRKRDNGGDHEGE